MLNVNVTNNFGDVSAEVRAMFEKQIPYSALLGLNSAMFKATQDVRKTMPFFIEGGPVAFTKRGFQYTKAKNKRNLRAKIFIPDEQWEYMRFVVDGGDQGWSRSIVGGFNPVGGRVKRNKYGNIPGYHKKNKLWRELAQRAGAKRSSGQVATPLKKTLSNKSFVGYVKSRTGGSILGVWERKPRRGGLKLIGSYDHSLISYGAGRVPFRKFAIRFGVKRFRREFRKKFEQVMKAQNNKLMVK